MHVIICGGRSEHLTRDRVRWLDAQRLALPITHVYHGDAPGIDTDAARWAQQWGIPVTAFPADWERHGPAAGPLRNTRMLRALQRDGRDASFAVLAFPGGTGTTDMMRKAQGAGVRLIDVAKEMTNMPTVTTRDPTPPASPSVVLYGDRMTELAVVLDQMQVPPYNVPPTKLQKAYEAVLKERVSPRAECPNETLVVSSTDAWTIYKTNNGTCDCPFGRAYPQERYTCYHTVAARLYQRWRQSLAPLASFHTENHAMPTTTKDEKLSAPAPTTKTGPPPPEPDDIPEHAVPAALLSAVTASPPDPSTPAASDAPPVPASTEWAQHEALLSGFLQYLQGKMHAWMMEEHRTLTAGMDTTMTGMRDYAQSVLQSNEHAAYQLSNALLKLQEQGLPLRHDPYVVDVVARSPQGFAVRIHVNRGSRDELLDALPALLAWLADNQFTPMVPGGVL